MCHKQATFKTTPYVIVFSFLLCSCLGVNADITLNKNGSGIITLEYTISKSLDSLGRLDGNERWNTIPVGKADFERTMDRLPDMKLLSFSTKENDRDLVFIAKMEFSSVKGLLAFLDSGGLRSDFSGDAERGRLVLVLKDVKTTAVKGSSLDTLLAEVTKSYPVTISMNIPGTGNLKIIDNSGNAVNSISGSVIQDKGKRLSCSFSLYEILSSSNGLKIEFQWDSST